MDWLEFRPLFCRGSTAGLSRRFPATTKPTRLHHKNTATIVGAYRKDGVYHASVHPPVFRPMCDLQSLSIQLTPADGHVAARTEVVHNRAGRVLDVIHSPEDL